jgi:CHAT domain-containing protein
MGTRRYENFDLLIEAEGEGRYRVRVTDCPVGDTPTSVFSLPFSPTELENLLLKLDPGRSGMRRITDRHTQASTDLGSGLFDAVFRDGVLVAWSRSKDAVWQQGRGLRLRLRLTDAPALAAMPWELLYDKSARMFYAQSDRTPVVRYLDVTNPPRPLTVQGPLRILVIIASPRGLPRLNVEREWATICDALADKQRAGLVLVDRLPTPTISELQRWLRHNDVHVLHFVGHGYFDDRFQDGTLIFTDAEGRAAPISSTILGTHIRDHDPLRLVVLNACQTARVDDADPYSGMAQGLIQQEAAAVVAMQFPISDDAAIVFTRDFYGAVADGEPLDQAMASARKALLADHGTEWATPVLFLRAADGWVFDRREEPERLAASLPPLTLTDPGTTHQVTTRPNIQQVPMADGPEAHVPSSQDWRTLQSAVASMPPNLKESAPQPFASPSETKPLLDKPSGRSYGRSTPGPRRRRKRYWIGAAAAVTIASVISIALVLGRTPHSLTSHASGRASARPSDVTSSSGNASVSYKRYTNPRYGFSTLWPSSLKAQAPLPNGDGQTWASPDGQVVLAAFGRNNTRGLSPEQDEAADSKGLSQVFNNINGNVVTVSGYKNGGRTIVYQRDVVGATVIDILYWSYPAAEKTQWDGPVTQTAHAFQPGDVTTPH